MANEIYHRSNWGNAVNDIAWGDTYEKFDATNEMFVRSDNYENSNETDKLMAAINPKPSILLTPTAYDNGSLHSVKPVDVLGNQLVAETPNNLNGWIDARDNTTLSIVDNNIRATLEAGTSVTIGISSTGFTTVIGKTYEVKIIATKNNSSGSIYARISNNSQITAPVFNEQNLTASISVNSTFVATATTSFIGVLATAQAGGDYIQSSLMSVKEVTDADFDFTRGSSATRVNEQGLIEDVQILSGELVQNGDFEQIGSELVTNGDFATDSDWVKNTGWSISGGAANASSSFDSLAQAGFNFIIEKNYKVTYEVKNYVNGNIRFQFTGGATLTGTTRNSNGIYTQYVKATANHSNFRFKGTNFTGSIDNVSVKEVGQNWALNAAWTISNGKATYDNSASQSCEQSLNFEVGKKYLVNFEISDFTTNYRFDVYTGVSFIQSAIITNQTSYSILFDGDGGNKLRFRGLATGTGFSLDNVSVKEVTEDTDLPRIDYTDGTGSLLLEPQSTNRLTYSEDFTQSIWTNARSSGATNQIIAPDGTATGYKLIDSTDNNTHLLYSTQTVTTSSVFAFSVFLKKGSLNNAFIAHDSSIDQSVVFDLQNGTIVSTGSDVTSSKIESFDNDWYRCSFTHTPTSTVRLYRVGTYNGNISYSGSGSDFVYCWGAQLEQQSYATSYIPTSGSAVTRDADVCNNSGSSDLINSTEGVLYAEISSLANDGTSRRISLSSGSDANRVSLEIDETSNRIKVFMNGGGISAAIITFDASDLTQFNKIAIKYKSGDVSLFLNGTEVATSTSTNMPVGLDRLNFDGGNLSNDYFGNVKSVAVFKEALTDEELTALTT
jgi:hypothetical protein